MKTGLRTLVSCCLSALVLAVSGCKCDSSSAPRSVAIEFVEVVSSGTPRHVYDQAGQPTELSVASALPASGTVTGVSAGEKEVTFALSTTDSEKLKAWTSLRMDKEMAVLVSDQVLIRATIHGALWGQMALPIPAEIRSPDLKAAIEDARKKPR